MIPPPSPPDEDERLAALEALSTLDLPGKSVCEAVARLAQQIFQIRMAGISFIDRRRQWFINHVPDFPQETSREISFAGHVLALDSVLVVEDTLLDARFADNPHVVSSPHVRFYAGCAVHSPEGHAIGVLSLMDTRPRRMSEDEKEALKELGTMIECELKHRSASQTITLPMQSIPSLTYMPRHRQMDAVAPLDRPPPVQLDPEVLDEHYLQQIVQSSSLSPYYLARVLGAFREQCEKADGILRCQPSAILTTQIDNLAASAAHVGADKLAMECNEWTSSAPPARLLHCLSETSERIGHFLRALPVEI